jgi:uncharacterized membrane protein YqjE
MDDPEPKSGGLFASVCRIGDSVLALLGVRLELAALELQEEKVRLLDLLLRLAVCIVLGTLVLLSATALVVVIFVRVFHYSPVITLAVITAVYGLAALALWWDLQRRVNTAPPPFADTLAELKKDSELFRDKK